MFQINDLFLKKIGWSNFRQMFTTPFIVDKFPEDLEILWYWQGLTTFIITRNLDSKPDYHNKSKQLSDLEYKFIELKDTGVKISFSKKVLEIKIESNLHLMKLVYKHEPCNDDYKRHFKILKILK